MEGGGPMVEREVSDDDDDDISIDVVGLAVGNSNASTGSTRTRFIRRLSSGSTASTYENDTRGVLDDDDDDISIDVGVPVVNSNGSTGSTCESRRPSTGSTGSTCELDTQQQRNNNQVSVINTNGRLALPSIDFYISCRCDTSTKGHNLALFSAQTASIFVTDIQKTRDCRGEVHLTSGDLDAPVSKCYPHVVGENGSVLLTCKRGRVAYGDALRKALAKIPIDRFGKRIERTLHVYGCGGVHSMASPLRNATKILRETMKSTKDPRRVKLYLDTTC